MSRVHDALRRAEQLAANAQSAPPADAPVSGSPEPESAPAESVAEAAREQVAAPAAVAVATTVADQSVPAPTVNRIVTAATAAVSQSFAGSVINPNLLSTLRQVPFTPAADAHIIDLHTGHESPA